MSVKKLTKAKVVILGAAGVGKTAFAVRYLTKRFIGEYDQSKEMLYTHRVQFEREDISLDILDTASSSDLSTLETHVTWADGYILMYSITDEDSFKRLQRFRRMIESLRSEDMPIVIVANKSDMIHARVVNSSQGWGLGKVMNCPHCEVSIMESANGVFEAMDELLKLIKKSVVGPEKKSVLLNVRRAFRKRYTKSKSDGAF